MRLAGWLALYSAAVFLGGALVAPWIYWGVQTLGAASGGWLFELGQKPFYRFVHRSLLIAAIAGLGCLARRAGLGSWSAVGLPWRKNRGREAAGGFLLGCVMAGIWIAFAAAISGWNWRPGPAAGIAWLGQAIKILAAAALVGIVEEIIFRGVLFGLMRRAYGWWPGAVASSAIYSWVHFFAHPASIGPVRWHSGFTVLGQMLSGLADGRTLFPGFLNLFLAGMILALLVDRLGALYAAIGLHASWIVWLKLLANHSGAPSQPNWFFAGGDWIQSWGLTPVFAVFFSALFYSLPRQEEPGGGEI